MTDQTESNRCPRCNKVVAFNEIHQCYDPFGESYFNPSMFSPALVNLAFTMKEISESLKEISKRLKYIEDDVRRQK